MLSGMLQRQLYQSGNEHILLLNSGRTEEAVFIIPGSDGICDGYDELAKGLEDSGAVYGLQMMGLFKGEKPLDSIQDIAKVNIGWIKSVQPAGPYRLIGHSFGGCVAYEMAQQLERAGEQVDLVAILDAPAIPVSKIAAQSTESKGDMLLKTLEYYHLVQTPYPAWVETLLKSITDVRNEDLMSFMTDFLHNQTVIKEEDVAFILRLLDLQVTNVQIGYAVRDEVKASLVIVKAEEEDWTNYEDDLGWGRHAANTAVYTVPGNHFSMVKNAGALTLAACLKTHIGCFTDL